MSSGSRRSWVAPGAIMLGLATLIFIMMVMMMMMKGFRQELLSKVLSIDGHLVVTSQQLPFTDFAQTSERISRIPGVRLAAPIVEGQVLATSPFNSSSVLARGMRVADLQKLPSIAANIKRGTLEGFDAGQGVLIGKQLADQLSLRLGDTITLVAPRGEGAAPSIKPYKVAAMFEIGMAEYDRGFIYMPLGDAQAYFSRAGDVTAIEVFIDNPDEVDRFKPLVANAAERPTFIINWRQRNASFFSAL
jgi:lipoprotein-releasing system permease protein